MRLVAAASAPPDAGKDVRVTLADLPNTAGSAAGRDASTDERARKREER